MQKVIFIFLVTYRDSSNLELADLATETDHLVSWNDLNHIHTKVSRVTLIDRI